MNAMRTLTDAGFELARVAYFVLRAFSQTRPDLFAEHAARNTQHTF
jgi:hypothetical protein